MVSNKLSKFGSSTPAPSEGLRAAMSVKRLEDRKSAYKLRKSTRKKYFDVGFGMCEECVWWRDRVVSVSGILVKREIASFVEI